MVDKDLRKELEDFVKNHMNAYAFMLQKCEKYLHLKNFVIEFTSQISDLSFPAKVYCTINNLTTYPKCKVCGKELRHDIRCNPLTGFYASTCSNSCAQKSDDCQKKKMKTSLERYGVVHPSQSAQFKEKFNATISTRDQSKVESSNEKRKQTCIEKYGVDSISKVGEIKDKASASFKNRTDAQKKETVAKMLNTKLQKYGVDNISNQSKAKQTKSQFSKQKLESIQEKRKNTCIAKYGVDSVSKDSAIKYKARLARNKKLYTSIYENSIACNEFVDPLFTLEQYLENPHSSFQWKCKKCGAVFSSRKHEHQSHIARCLKCYPLSTSSSHGEEEIASFLKTFYNGDVIRNSRLVIYPNELDIYVPEKKFAIEYDGIYWHSEQNGCKNDYHMLKTNECESLGIHLVHIFDYEWHEKNNIVKSRIKDIFGCYEKTIFARKCKINIVPRKEAYAFLNENHLQGQCISSINVGLFIDNELVSLMTFGKCRFDKKHEWELLRFCNKLGFHVPGAASRLLKYFERSYSPKSIVSYADRRWSQGNMYEKIGFQLANVSKPNYWYWNAKDFNGLENRIKYQKHRLKDILENFDETKTEVDNMINNNFYRVFDCGNLVYEKMF